MIITKWISHGIYDTPLFKRILAWGITSPIFYMAQVDWNPLACLLAASVGLALWLKGAEPLPKRYRFYASLVWMASIQAIHQNWMTVTEYTGPLILVGWVLHCLSYGCIFGGWVLCVGSKPSFSKIMVLSCLWLILERIRPILFFGLGFSWNPLGLMWTAHPWPLQCATLFGLSGLTFWVIASNLMLYRYRWRGLWAPLLPFFLGAFLFFYPPMQERGSPLHILLVQPAKPPWEDVRAVWDRLIDLLASPQQIEPHDLIVLPEGGLPYTATYPYIPPDIYRELLVRLGVRSIPDIDTYQSNLDLLQAWSCASSQAILVGMNDDQKEHGCFNSAFFIHPELDVQTHHKQWLVPFGEYVPWTFRWILNWLPIDPGFTKGRGGTVLTYQAPFSVAICYEETLGKAHRKRCLEGAQFLVGLTNDVWYPHSRLPITHVHHARLRAVELGIPMVRACNTGVSCVIDPKGEILSTIPYESKHQVAASATCSVNMRLDHRPTLYLFWGELPLWGCGLSAALTLVIKRRMRYSRAIFGSIA